MTPKDALEHGKRIEVTCRPPWEVTNQSSAEFLEEVTESMTKIKEIFSGNSVERSKDFPVVKSSVNAIMLVRWVYAQEKAKELKTVAAQARLIVQQQEYNRG